MATVRGVSTTCASVINTHLDAILGGFRTLIDETEQA